MQDRITVHGPNPWGDAGLMAGAILPLNNAPVNVIDSVVITQETDPSRVLAQWTAFDPNIAVYSELRATQAVRLFLNWSDQNGTIDLQQGDFFTFVIPDIFLYEYIADVADAPITNDAGEVVATYSIYTNANNLKEVRVTFTPYVNDHTGISGDFWMLLFVGRVNSTEQKTIEFVINDSVVAYGEVTVNPNTGTLTPRNRKIGYSSPDMIAGGYYIFEWLVYINMDPNADLGFFTRPNFSFEDIIPANSPHIFLPDEIRQELGIPPTDYQPLIGEYTGADPYPPENRYQVFLNHYNSVGADIWYSFINWAALTDGLATVGIDGGGGLAVSDIAVADKLFSANLGTLTRPTALHFYTISTIRMTESALGDSQVAGLFRNLFEGSSGEALNASLSVYHFGAGGSAQGITGDYGFSFVKIDQNGVVLPDAMFSLYAGTDFGAGAIRFVFSGANGVVDFVNLPAGTYYLRETMTPTGYIPNDTIYRVVIASTGFEIYYGDNFENRLSDIDYRVINRSEFITEPVSVMLTGTKYLEGKTLESGAFGFIIRDANGNIAATGANDADGIIRFSSIGFDVPGVYVFTVEEAMSGNSRIIYDGSIFTVVVTVTEDGSGGLMAEVAYPDGDIVFNNIYDVPPPEEPDPCCKPCCKPCCCACCKPCCCAGCTPCREPHLNPRHMASWARRERPRR